MLTPSYVIPSMPPPGVDLDAPEVLKALAAAHRHLAELKGCAKSIPNHAILIDTLALQEAKASSEIESYVTTQDELFQADFELARWVSPAAKEVSRYREALKQGFVRMKRQQGLLSNSTLVALFQDLKNSSETFRRMPGTVLKNDKTGTTVFVPPQDARASTTACYKRCATRVLGKNGCALCWRRLLKPRTARCARWTVCAS